MKYGDIKKENFCFEIKHNENDDFSQCLIANGIYIRNGGTPVNYIIDKIVTKIREKLVKKFPSIKKGDIKNKLKILLVMRFFPNLKFTSQEKIEVSNSTKELSEFFGSIDFDKIAKQILKDDSIMLNITEYFTLKEKAKEQAKLKELEKKTKKRIKTEKYYPATKIKKYLFIAEGQSASSSMLKILGRETNGFYELKGKPLNVLNISPSKFMCNDELKNLYEIIVNENYEKIVILSDNDLDGTSIAGLLITFFYKYFENLLKENKIFRFYTPIAASLDRNKKLINWVYNFDEINNLRGEIKYYKGLGGWKPEQLEQVIKKDGFNKMLEPFSYSEEDKEYIYKWFSQKKSDERKEAIMQNDFDIIKL